MMDDIIMYCKQETLLLQHKHSSSDSLQSDSISTTASASHDMNMSMTDTPIKKYVCNINLSYMKFIVCCCRKRVSQYWTKIRLRKERDI